MTKNETLHIRVNSEVKENAEKILNTLGLSISEAVNIFLCQVNLVSGIPFEIKLPNYTTPDMDFLSSEQTNAEIEKDVEE
ncbi:MAG: type II toxin-antitoxin system RelB/DinJ family antitoxin [Oscillospiraceae bacterium]|nr:type II toxin-antitoxin system RelB/DinJ family antitoxin [Oscillospiraceae bacterium]